MITTPELLEFLDQNKDMLLIDVREPFEIASYGKIPSATNMPLSTLKENLHTLPKNKLIIFYCRSGARSAKATKLAKKYGLQAENYKGGVLEFSTVDDSVKAY